MTNIKFDLNDISLVPAVLSTIRSRKELKIEYDGPKERKTGLSSRFPLIVSPMDTVINDKNTMSFYGMLTCSIRKETPEYTAKYSFISVSFEQFIAMCDEEKAPQTCLGILIDIANGHMKDLYDYVQIFKTNNPNIPLMVGNIANPETYRAYCNILTDIDFVRIGIGGGSACTTSANTSVHYPMGSLIKECYDISATMSSAPMIVADGGFRNFDDIIKALNLGADYVMIGGIFAKTLEACGDVYWKGIKVTKFKWWMFKHGFKLQRKYRGMSTKEVQKSFGNTTLKTAEGISYWTPVDTYLYKWVENFQDYLKSAMSYCGAHTIQEFVGQQNNIHISEQAIKRYKK